MCHIVKIPREFVAAGYTEINGKKVLLLKEKREENTMRNKEKEDRIDLVDRVAGALTKMCEEHCKHPETATSETELWEICDRCPLKELIAI